MALLRTRVCSDTSHGCRAASTGAHLRPQGAEQDTGAVSRRSLRVPAPPRPGAGSPGGVFTFGWAPFALGPNRCESPSDRFLRVLPLGHFPRRAWASLRLLPQVSSSH